MGSEIQEEKVSGERRVIIAERVHPKLAETIGVTLDENGMLNFHGQDLGDAVKRTEDEDEYEYGVTVPASEIGNLVLLLLKENMTVISNQSRSSKSSARPTRSPISFGVTKRHVHHLIRTQDV